MASDNSDNSNNRENTQNPEMEIEYLTNLLTACLRLRPLGICGRSLRQAVSNMSVAAERASEWLWVRRKHTSWGAS